MDTISGFDIERRVLTPEESTRTISLSRFTEFHQIAGEDFLDQTSEGNVLIYSGWLMHKYPQYSKEILEVANRKYGEIMSFKDTSIYSYSYNIDDDFYRDFALFCNQTRALKERVNQVLIQVTEHYQH